MAKSSDGVNFKPVCEVGREAFGAASLERPVILPTEVGWRLYLSCATPNSKHWWIDALDAERPEELPFGDRHVVLAGDAGWAVKDPVIMRGAEGWRMWVAEHHGRTDRTACFPVVRHLRALPGTAPGTPPAARPTPDCYARHQVRRTPVGERPNTCSTWAP